MAKMTKSFMRMHRAAIVVAALTISLLLPACSSIDFRDADLRPMLIGPVSLWLPKNVIASNEQRACAIRGFEHYKLQNLSPAGFWARLVYNHETKLRSKGVKHIAVCVPTAGKVPAGWMLVGVHSGRPINRVYEVRSKSMRHGSYVLIGGHKALVFAPSSNQARRLIENPRPSVF